MVPNKHAAPAHPDHSARGLQASMCRPLLAQKFTHASFLYCKLTLNIYHLGFGHQWGETNKQTLIDEVITHSAREATVQQDCNERLCHDVTRNKRTSRVKINRANL